MSREMRNHTAKPTLDLGQRLRSNLSSKSLTKDGGDITGSSCSSSHRIWLSIKSYAAMCWVSLVNVIVRRERGLKVSWGVPSRLNGPKAAAGKRQKLDQSVDEKTNTDHQARRWQGRQQKAYVKGWFAVRVMMWENPPGRLVLRWDGSGHGK